MSHSNPTPNSLECKSRSKSLNSSPLRACSKSVAKCGLHFSVYLIYSTCSNSSRLVLWNLTSDSSILAAAANLEIDGGNHRGAGAHVVRSGESPRCLAMLEGTPLSSYHHSVRLYLHQQDACCTSLRPYPPCRPAQQDLSLSFSSWSTAFSGQEVAMVSPCKPVCSTGRPIS